MCDYSYAFVSYLPVYKAKHYVCGRHAYDTSPPIFRFSVARDLHRNFSGSCSRYNVSMKVEREGSETFETLKTDIQEYLANAAEDIPNPLSYVNLKNNGRIDLVSRIMDAGGYIEVSKRLGVPIDETQFIPPPSVVNGGQFKLFSEPEDQGASIAVGKSLEGRMKSVDQVVNQKDSSNSMPKSSSFPRIEEVPSAAELIERNKRILPRVIDEPSIEGESLSLTILMRFGVLALTATTAVGFGKASNGLISPNIITTSRAVASGLIFAHSFLALYSGLLLAPRMHRSSIVWFIKVLLGGPLAVVELRSLDRLHTSR